MASSLLTPFVDRMILPGVVFLQNKQPPSPGKHREGVATRRQKKRFTTTPKKRGQADTKKNTYG
jgi:hypothetical protein